MDDLNAHIKLVRRYAALSIDNDYLPSEMYATTTKGDVIANVTAVVLGYFALRLTTSFVAWAIDHILLNNFPLASEQWCFARGGRPSELQRAAKHVKVIVAGIVGVLWVVGWLLCGMRLWHAVCVVVPFFVMLQLSILIVIKGAEVWMRWGAALAERTGWSPASSLEDRNHQIIGNNFESNHVSESRFEDPSSWLRSPSLPSSRTLRTPYPPIKRLPPKDNHGQAEDKQNAAATKQQAEPTTQCAPTPKLTEDFQSISSKDGYRDKSFEELRLEEYDQTNGIAVATPAKSGGAFGTLINGNSTETPWWLRVRRISDSIFTASTPSRDSVDLISFAETPEVSQVGGDLNQFGKRDVYERGRTFT